MKGPTQNPPQAPKKSKIAQTSDALSGLSSGIQAIGKAVNDARLKRQTERQALAEKSADELIAKNTNGDDSKALELLKTDFGDEEGQKKYDDKINARKSAKESAEKVKRQKRIDNFQNGIQEFDMFGGVPDDKKKFLEDFIILIVERQELLEGLLNLLNTFMRADILQGFLYDCHTLNLNKDDVNAIKKENLFKIRDALKKFLDEIDKSLEDKIKKDRKEYLNTLKKIVTEKSNALQGILKELNIPAEPINSDAYKKRLNGIQEEYYDKIEPLKKKLNMFEQTLNKIREDGKELISEIKGVKRPNEMLNTVTIYSATLNKKKAELNRSEITFRLIKELTDFVILDSKLPEPESKRYAREKEEGIKKFFKRIPNAYFLGTKVSGTFVPLNVNNYEAIKKYVLNLFSSKVEFKKFCMSSGLMEYFFDLAYLSPPLDWARTANNDTIDDVFDEFQKLFVEAKPTKTALNIQEYLGFRGRKSDIDEYEKKKHEYNELRKKEMVMIQEIKKTKGNIKEIIEAQKREIQILKQKFRGSDTKSELLLTPEMKNNISNFLEGFNNLYNTLLNSIRDENFAPVFMSFVNGLKTVYTNLGGAISILLSADNIIYKMPTWSDLEGNVHLYYDNNLDYHIDEIREIILKIINNIAPNQKLNTLNTTLKTIEDSQDEGKIDVVTKGNTSFFNYYHNTFLVWLSSQHKDLADIINYLDYEMKVFDNVSNKNVYSIYTYLGMIENDITNYNLRFGFMKKQSIRKFLLYALSGESEKDSAEISKYK